MQHFTFLILVLALNLNISFSQNVQIDWSDKVRRFFHGDGTFDKYVGESNEYVYATFFRGNKINLLRFEKSQMIKNRALRIKGFKQNVSNSLRFFKRNYLNTIVTDSSIFVFWYTLRGGSLYKTEKVFVTKYDHNFNLIFKYKEVYKYENYSSGNIYSQKDKSSLFVLFHPTYSKNIIIGSEQFGNIKNSIDYSLFDHNLKQLSHFKNELPQQYLPFSELNSSFFLLPGDKILVKHFRPVFYIENLFRKIMKFRHDNTIHRACTYFSVINAKDGQQKTYSLTDHSQLIQDVTFDFKANQLVFSGGWNDYSKNPYGDSLSGFFLATIQLDSFKASELLKIKFDKSIIHLINGSEKVKTEEGLYTSFLFQRNKQLLDNFPQLEKTMITSDTSVALVISNTFFDAIDAFDTSKTNFAQHYFKRNINVINVALSSGEIIWSNDIQRSVTYYEPFTNDLTVLRKDTSLYLFYGDGDYSTKDIPFHSLVREKQNLGYSIVNLSNGSITHLDGKSLFPGEIHEINNHYFLKAYTYSWIPINWNCFFGRIKF